MEKKPYVVGLGGSSASGKTTFVHQLQALLGAENIAVVSQDNYYRPIHEQKEDENGVINFDLPTSIDREHFAVEVCKLVANQPIQCHVYNFNVDGGKPEVKHIAAAPVVLVEGLFIYHYTEIDALLDLRLFIDAPEPLKLARRLERDIRERGYTHEAISYQWQNHVQPSFEAFLEPYRNQVDLVINNAKAFDRALEVVANHLRALR